MFYPLIGTILGAILVGLNTVFSTIFPRGLTDALLLVALAFLTGALHMDGLCDLMDAYKGGANREKIIAIMKDTHIGAIGVVGIALFILVKYLSLTYIPVYQKSKYLLIAPTLGRWSILQMVFMSKYARDTDGLGSPLIKYTTTKGFIIGVFTVFFLVTLLLGYKGLIIWLISSIFTLWFTKYNEGKICGITGDIMGASCELNEALVFILGCGAIW